MAQGPIARCPIAKRFTAVACIALGMVLGTSQEKRIQMLRQGTWLGELNTDSTNNEQLAHSWRNGGGHRWGNGSNRWRNGGGRWGNSGRYYYGGGGIHLNLGWPNGGWGNVIPRGFFNW